jgi:cell division protein FtsW (lipid II flippase)
MGKFILKTSMKNRYVNQRTFIAVLLFNVCITLFFVEHNLVLNLLSFFTGLMILYLMIFMRKWYLIVACCLVFFFQFFYVVVNDRKQDLMRAKKAYYES